MRGGWGGGRERTKARESERERENLFEVVLGEETHRVGDGLLRLALPRFLFGLSFGFRKS